MGKYREHCCNITRHAHALACSTDAASPAESARPVEDAIHLPTHLHEVGEELGWAHPDYQTFKLKDTTYLHAAELWRRTTWLRRRRATLSKSRTPPRRRIRNTRRRLEAGLAPAQAAQEEPGRMAPEVQQAHVGGACRSALVRETGNSRQSSVQAFARVGVCH